MTTQHAFTVTVATGYKDIAERVRAETEGELTNSGFDMEGLVQIGPLVEIEMMQLVGIKDGREVDLGDMPLSPEMKMREIARNYGNPDDEDDYPAGVALGAMQDLITWMREQGKLK